MNRRLLAAAIALLGLLAASTAVRARELAAPLPSPGTGSAAALFTPVPESPQSPVAPKPTDPQWKNAGCWYGYQYCSSQCYLYGDPDACQHDCTCSYYACIGLELGGDCI